MRLFLALSLTVATLSGCFLAPIIQAFSELGITPADRRRLLAENIKVFHASLQWGDLNRAVAYASPEVQKQLSQRYRGRLGKDERITDVQVIMSTFDDNARKATVEVLFRRFVVPYYTLDEQRIEQVWEYEELAGSWRLIEWRDPS